MTNSKQQSAGVLHEQLLTVWSPSGMITAVRQNSHDIANNIQFTLCRLVYKNIQFSCIRFCGKTVKKLAW